MVSDSTVDQRTWVDVTLNPDWGNPGAVGHIIIWFGLDDEVGVITCW